MFKFKIKNVQTKLTSHISADRESLGPTQNCGFAITQVISSTTTSLFPSIAF